MKKSISILGSTGSIGTTVLKIIDKKKNNFKIDILSANKNTKIILKQIIKYKPKYFIINNKKSFLKIKKDYSNKKTKIFNNFNSIKINKKSDICVSAIPGIAGLEPTILMISNSKKILIANKESIICGWNIIKQKAKKYNTKIIPVDSEHFSIMKLFENHKIKEIDKVFITASGGPFLNYKLKQFNHIKPSDALKHPKWKMGKKVTIDSSTMMNKLLEIIEAQKLFNIPSNKIDILIHPNSLVHAIVKLKNGLVKFIYHETSMIIPITNAIFDGKLEIRDFYRPLENKKISTIKNLYFEKVNRNIFPMVNLKNKINQYPSTSIIINAANEILVDQFLLKKIPFLAIYKIIMTILKDRNYKKYAIRKPKNIRQIIEIDTWAKAKTLNKVKLKYE